MTELWLPVVGFEGRYEVSSLGRVRGCGSRARGVKKPYVSPRNGYVQYCFYVERGRPPRNYHGHTIVAAAFIGPRPDGMCVCHNDGNPGNNALENLRYDTPAGNSADMRRHGTNMPGEKNPQAVLTEPEVREIKSLRGTNTYRNIAGQFGVSFATIQKIMSGEGWRHVQ